MPELRGDERLFMRITTQCGRPISGTDSSVCYYLLDILPKNLHFIINRSKGRAHFAFKKYKYDTILVVALQTVEVHTCGIMN